MLISKAVIPLILSHKRLCFSLREALAVPEIQLLDELMETFFSADAKPHIANTDCVFLEFADTKTNKLKQWGLFIECTFFFIEAVREYSTAKSEGKCYIGEFHIDLPKQGIAIYELSYDIFLVIVIDLRQKEWDFRFKLF